MTTIEHAGVVMMHVQQGNQAIARTILASLRAAFAQSGPASGTASGAPRDTALSGPSFLQLEPGLALETARIPAF